MKRLCLLLLLAYVGLSPTFAYDFSSVCSSGQTLYYDISGSTTVAVTCPSTQSWDGYTMPSGELVIPETVEYGGLSYTVTSIGEYAFYYCTGLTSISIPNSVLTIGDYSFNHCTGITELTIPSSVLDIGVWAFGYCDALPSVTIGSSVSIIRQNAFPTPLQSIISLNPVAPQWVGNPFQWNDPSTPIYIPAGSLSSYQNTWWKFSNFIETNPQLLDSASCSIKVKMYDSYGDGWNGASLKFYDGNSLIASLSMSDGSYYETTLLLDADSVSLMWNSGYYDDECSFTITSAEGDILFSMSSFYGGEGIIGGFHTNCSACPSPRNLRLLDRGVDFLTIGWDDEQGFSWIVNYSTDATDSIYSVEVTTDSLRINGLSPSTYYHIYIRGICESGDTSRATSARFLTLCDGTNCVFSDTIGNGTESNHYLPSYSYYDYSYTQQIFTADEIGHGGTITSLAFMMSSVVQQRTYEIYLGHIDEATSSTFLTPNDLTLVYSDGQIPMSVNQWTTFELTTPFYYDGIRNLLVVFRDVTGSWIEGNRSYVHYVPDGTSRYVYQDGSLFYPGDVSGGTSMSVRNNMIFAGITNNITSDSSNTGESCTFSVELSSRNNLNGGSRGWLSVKHGNVVVGSCGSGSWSEDNGFSSSSTFTSQWDSVSFVWHGGSSDGGDLVVIKDQWGATRYSGHVSVVSYFSNGYSWSESTLHLLDGMGNDYTVTDTTLFDVLCLDSSDIHHISIQSNQNGMVSVNNTWNNSDWEYVHDGTVVTITATPNTNAELQYLRVNGVEVSVPYTMTVTSDVLIEAAFFYNLPELHVTNLSCSELVSGHEFSVSWTVQNDGNSATPVGTTWYDRLYLSTIPYLDYNTIGDAELIGSWQNISALGVGENYTRTITSSLAERHGTGTYYLIILSDANYAYDIEWPDSTMPTIYSPPPYIRAKSYAWADYENVSEISEQGTYTYDWNDETYRHDNFNIKTIQVALPPLPDLEVTNIVHPTNFYSGTEVTVTATITNTGEALTLSNGWRDVLYISTSPEFSSSKLQLSSVWHNGSIALAPDSSYQVTFTGTVPLSWYGEAYFFVTTDPDDNEYEHIANDNNTSRSNAVNIILTPPADLVVSNVSIPSVASNQMPFAMSYTVSNAGLGSPDVNNWVDRVYLSTCPTLPYIQFESGGWFWDYNTWQEYSYSSIDDTTNWCYLMETINHTDGLTSGSDYSVNRTYTLPSFITRADTFYFIVVTDANSQVFEYQSEDNNTMASNASVISFFFPDLVIDTIIVPDSIDNNHTFNVSFTVSNQGLGKAEGPWNDRISIYGTQLELVTHYGTLMPGESYSVSRTCNVPSSFSWSDFRDLTVTTDYNCDVDEKTAENNNSLSAYPYITVFKPDLSLSSIQFPDTVVTNHSANISFTLHNYGQRYFSGYNYYHFYYSTDSVLNIDWRYPTNATYLTYIQPYTYINAEDSQTVSHTLTLPSDIDDGDYFIHIIVDMNEYVSEENEQNNTVCSNKFHLCHRALPDLVVCNVSIPDTMQAGQTALLTFDIVNNGETTDVGPADILSSRCLTRLGAAGCWCPVEMQITPYPIGTITLVLGDTLHYSQTVLVPPTSSGNTIFTLSIDASNNIMELNEENNSATLSSFVEPIGFDIEMVSITAPDSYNTGDTVTFSWTVDMTDAMVCYNYSGHGMTDVTGYYDYLNWNYISSGTLWKDRLYISTDNTISSEDILLGEININHDMMSDDSYTASVSVAMPHNLTGNLYLIASSDPETNMVENNRSNNTLTKTITATLAPMPNLRVTAFTMDDTVTQRQGCMIHYTVVNDGNGDIVGGTWTDKFYCGTSLIATVLHDAPLAAGATYSDSVEVVIPSNLLGNYTLHAVTDADNTVFEHDGENDNSLTRPVLVLQAPPCDLIVTNVEAAANVVVGSTLNVSWTVQNIGDNVVSGYVKDGIYLSLDTVFDNSDVMIGSLSYYNSFDVYGSTQRTVGCNVQGVTAGNYHALVRTNIMRAFNEVSFDNNVCASVATTEVALPTLTIGQAEQLTIASGGHAYYRLVVGQEYTGQTLALTLSTEVDNSFNGLYLSYESMPSAARSDYGVSTPYARNQQILVPVLQQGIYYLMASASTSNRTPQQITLLAEIIDFEILHVNTASGTNTGSVTTKITGAKFDTIMDFRLTDANGYTPAQKVKFENSTNSYVTFNLIDLPAGTYNVEAELPGGIITMKEGAFVVEQGLPAELGVNIVAPSSVRVGNSTTVNIEYGNNGSTDLNVSGFMVVSANGHPIGTTIAELAEGRDTVTFSTAEPGMDPDIIRPNYFATKTIYVNASTTGMVSIYVYPIRRRYE